MAWGALEIRDISFIPHLVAMVTRISKADSRWSSLVVRSTRSSAYVIKRAESSDETAVGYFETSHSSGCAFMVHLPHDEVHEDVKEDEGQWATLPYP